jgi:hypothetical protein
MTAMQINAELFRTMGEIADDEGLMLKLLKYAKKLVAKKNDLALMTKEESFARVDEAKNRTNRLWPLRRQINFLLSVCETKKFPIFDPFFKTPYY